MGNVMVSADLVGEEICCLPPLGISTDVCCFPLCLLNMTQFDLMESILNVFFLVNVFLKRGLLGVFCIFFFFAETLQFRFSVTFPDVAFRWRRQELEWELLCINVHVSVLPCEAAPRNDYCLWAQPRQQRADQGMKRRDSQSGWSSTCDVPRTQSCFPRGQRTRSVAVAFLAAGKVKLAARYCLEQGKLFLTDTVGCHTFFQKKKKPDIERKTDSLFSGNKIIWKSTYCFHPAKDWVVCLCIGFLNQHRNKPLFRSQTCLLKPLLNNRTTCRSTVACGWFC